jgi:hypothetical protein
MKAIDRRCTTRQIKTAIIESGGLSFEKNYDGA